MDKKSNPFFPGAGHTRETLYRKHLAEKRRAAFAKSVAGLIKNFINAAAFLFIFKIFGLIKITAANVFLYPLYWWVFLFALAQVSDYLKARKDR